MVTGFYFRHDLDQNMEKGAVKCATLTSNVRGHGPLVQPLKSATETHLSAITLDWPQRAPTIDFNENKIFPDGSYQS